MAPPAPRRYPHARGIRAAGAKLPHRPAPRRRPVQRSRSAQPGRYPQAEHQGSDMVGDTSPSPARSTRRRRAASRRPARRCSPSLLVTLAVAAAVTAPRAAAAPSLFELQKEAKRDRAEMASLQTDLQRVGRRARSRRRQQARRGQPASDALAHRPEAGRERARRCSARSSPSGRRRCTSPATWTGSTSSPASRASRTSTRIRSLQRAIADQDRRTENEAQRLAREARRLERQVEQDHEGVVAAEQEVQNQKIELDQKLAERSAILQDVTRRIKKILASGGLGAGAGHGQERAVHPAHLGPGAARGHAPSGDRGQRRGGHGVGDGRGRSLVQHGLLQPPQHHAEHAGRHRVQLGRGQGLHQLEAGTRGDRQDAAATATTATSSTALRRGNDSTAVAAAVGASPWGTGDFSRLL